MAERHAHPGSRVECLIPVLKVESPDATIDYYTSTLGFDTIGEAAIPCGLALNRSRHLMEKIDLFRRKSVCPGRFISLSRCG